MSEQGICGTLDPQAVSLLWLFLVVPCRCNERLHLSLCHVVGPVVYLSAAGSLPPGPSGNMISGKLRQFYATFVFGFFFQNFFDPNYFSPPKQFSHFHFLMHFWMFHPIIFHPNVFFNVLWVKQGATPCHHPPKSHSLESLVKMFRFL